MTSRLNRFLVLSGVFSALVFFIIAVPLGFFFPGYNHFDDVISEQGAVGSPIMLQANILFFFLGFFLFLFGLGLYRVYARNWTGKIGSIFIILAGLSATAVGFLPCDPGCVDVSIIGELHQVASEAPLLLSPIGLIFLTIQELWVGGLGEGGKKNIWVYVLLLFLIGGVIFGTIHLEFDLLFSHVGLFQRIAIGIPLLLVTIVSLALYRQIRTKRL